MSSLADGTLPDYASAFIDALDEAGVDLVAALQDSLLEHVSHVPYYGVAALERVALRGHPRAEGADGLI